MMEGRPLDPLQRLDRTGRIIYGVLLEGDAATYAAARISDLAGPLQPALRTAKRLSDWHGELPTQAALSRFIDEGLLADEA